MGEEYTLSSDHDFNVQSSQDLETTIIDANVSKKLHSFLESLKISELTYNQMP